MAVVLPDGLEGGNGSRGLFARVGEDPHPGSDSSAEVKSGDCGAGNECSARMGGARDRTHSRGFREAGLLVLVRLVGGPLAKVFIVVLGLAAWTLAAALDSGERQAEDLAEGRRRGGLETVLQTEGDVLLIDLGLGQGRRALTDGVVGEQPGEGGPMSQSVGRSISEPSLVLSGSPEREMISLHLFDLGGDDRFEVIFFFLNKGTPLTVAASPWLVTAPCSEESSTFGSNGPRSSFFRKTSSKTTWSAHRHHYHHPRDNPLTYQLVTMAVLAVLSLLVNCAADDEAAALVDTPS